jgi:Ser/Thr protein kinase RdoA (MazF antagonist)
MRTFFHGETSYEHPIADEITARWPTDGAVVKVWRASANFVFSVYTSGEQYFLRFNHESERDAKAISAELKYVDHLLRRDIRAAAPVLSSFGNYVESFSTEMGEFHAVLFQALTGEDWEINTLDENQFELWGQALGKMHAASKGFSTDHRPSWKEHVSFAEQLIPASEEDACRELDSIKEILTGLSSSAEDFGLIHFDFELDNLKWNKDEAGILDFDDCAFYWFEADIAFALRALFEDSADKVDFECKRFGAFLKGYRSEMQVSDAAVKRIPLFLRLHNLFSFARILRSLGDGPSREEPEWTANLRQRLTAISLEYRNQFERCPLNHDWT